MMPLLPAAVALMEPQSGAGHTAWVFSTVGHSEWCPPGTVMLDLQNGRFAFTARAARTECKNLKLERPVRRGALKAEHLASLRVVYWNAVRDGLKSQACVDNLPRKTFVITNGGTPILIVATGAMTRSAPDDLSCWSDAASALHRKLDDLFPSPRR